LQTACLPAFAWYFKECFVFIIISLIIIGMIVYF
jgi:uncharacterized protein YybS (DUF2232 family)